MIIRITKLHLLLFLTAVFLTFAYMFACIGSTLTLPSIGTIISRTAAMFAGRGSQPPGETPAPVTEPVAPPVVSRDVLRYAREVVAIAGEEMKIAGSRNKDIASGQQILRQAKELFSAGNNDAAIQKAREAIDQFQHAASRTLRATYTIQRGDTLWDISKRDDVYGRGAQWVTIWRANEKKIPDFDVICRNQELIIPRN
jgi:nucleoid-associated protein YgaU